MLLEKTQTTIDTLAENVRETYIFTTTETAFTEIDTIVPEDPMITEKSKMTTMIPDFEETSSTEYYYDPETTSTEYYYDQENTSTEYYYEDENSDENFIDFREITPEMLDTTVAPR